MAQPVSNPTASTIRVALVTGGLILGGTTTFLCNLAGELVRRNIPTKIFSFEKDNPLASDFDQLHIPVVCQDDGLAIFEDRMLATLNALDAFKPTVVLANLGPASFEILRYVPSGIFRIGVLHADSAPVYEMLRLYVSHLDLIVAVSQTTQHRLESMPEFRRVSVRCLHLGVPMPVCGGSREHDSQQPLRIIFLGRLEREQKRVHLFPTILKQLKAAGIPFTWTIAGIGPEESFLRRNLTNSPPRHNVLFSGKISYADVPGLLRRHDIFLLVSDYEGLPLSLLEAMGYGLVPVVSDLESGVRDVVNADNGVLIPIHDVEGYAQAIIHLHKHRDEFAAKSMAARQRVQTEFSAEAMTDRWLCLFPAPSAPVEWPATWHINSPLTDWRKPIYWPPFRWIRRLVKKYSHSRRSA